MSSAAQKPSPGTKTEWTFLHRTTAALSLVLAARLVFAQPANSNAAPTAVEGAAALAALQVRVDPAQIVAVLCRVSIAGYQM